MGDRLFGSKSYAPFTELDFDLGQGFEALGYLQSKFEAEMLIRNSKAQGLNWIIVRPGNILGEASSGAYPLMIPRINGIFYDLFKTFIETKTAFDSDFYYDITPVDYVARSIVYLVMKHPALYGTYHLTNPNPIYLRTIVQLIRDYGYDIQCITIDAYVNLFNNNLFSQNGKPYTSRTLELMRFSQGSSFIHQISYADTTITRKILEPAGIICPDADADLIALYLDYCKKVGYLQ